MYIRECLGNDEDSRELPHCDVADGQFAYLGCVIVSGLDCCRSGSKVGHLAQKVYA